MVTESRPVRSTAVYVIGMTSIQVALVGFGVWGTLAFDSLWPFAIAIPAIGMVAFAAIYMDTRRIRHAIGAAVILVYIAMLGFCLNSRVSQQVAANEFLKDLYNDFRTLVTTVSAFYFAADVTERIGTRGQPAGEGDAAARAQR